ncbi:MAG: glutamate racemase [Candidatus Paceibacterota bacterium]
MKIGFFDSGLGGLTILSAVTKLLPDYDYEFYGDTANLPYGDKTEDEIYQLTIQGIENLFAKNCTLVIVACNTASAETLRKLQKEYLPHQHSNKKVLGVIIPTIEALIEQNIKSSILIGTKRTINSQKYEQEIVKKNYEVKLTSIATPELVLLIENLENDKALENVVKIIEQRKNSEEGIVLGCTHYTVLKEKLQGKYAEQFKILSQDEIIPTKLKSYLDNHPEIENKLSKNKTRNIFLTEHKNKYDKFLQELLSGKFI